MRSRHYRRVESRSVFFHPLFSYIVGNGETMLRDRILIVEDDEFVRETIQLQLKKEKYQVLEAENGQEGIKVLLNGDNMEKVVLILCDLRMPIMSGEEFIKYLQELAPEMKVLVITGWPDVGLSDSLKAQGADGFLTKPFEKQKLLETIKGLVAN